MSANKKQATVISRKLAERLRKTLSVSTPSLLVTEGFDASSNPQINVDDGTPAAGEQCFYIRVIETPSIGNNSVGLSADSYGPHVIQIVMETSATAGVGVPSDLNKSFVWSSALLLGARVELYLRANGAVPVVGDITAANLVTQIDSDLMFGLYMDT